MTTRVDITNRSLQALGTRSTIVAMNEGSNEANNASLCYDTTRQECIRAAPWNFCRANITASLLKAAPGTPENTAAPGATWNQATQPPLGWNYQYAYPSDCLRMRKVVPNLLPQQGGVIPLFPSGLNAPLPFWNIPGMKFAVATDLDANNNPYTCILANIDQAILCYVRDIAIEDLWDPLFSKAMVMALAGKLALALTGDKELAQEMLRMADKVIMEARVADGNEGITVLDHTPEWISVAHGLINIFPTPGDNYALEYGPLFGIT